MWPTFKKGDQLITFNWAYIFKNPKSEDVVVVRFKDKEMIKRIQKTDGNQVFVIGDNEKESTDSRHFGLLKKGQIIGKVVYKQSFISRKL